MYETIWNITGSLILIQYICQYVNSVQPIGADTKQIMPSTQPPRSTGSMRHHTNSFDPWLGRQVGNDKASNHVHPLRRAHMMVHCALKVEQRAAASSACAAVDESRSSGASAPALLLPTPIASSPPMVCIVPKYCRRSAGLKLLQPPLVCQPAECWNRARW